MSLSRQEILARVAELERRFTELERQAAEAAGQGGDREAYQAIVRELSDLREPVSVYRTYLAVERDATEAEAIATAHGDLDLRELAREEGASLRRQQERLGEQLAQLWTARHQEPDRPLIVEIRAGTGGLEATLFVADLYRMYTKYAAKRAYVVEPLEAQPSDAGGFKEISFGVRGPGAWEQFKFERGVHRVQRVPQTEAQGRIHTSAVTVAVLPEPEDVELPPIPAKDLVIDVYRSSGPGGQGVNTTDSAVRIRHLPTGLVVTCQDERSQLRNKDKAMRVLRARLLDQVQSEHDRRIASERKRQVGSGDRSEKIRTYNFPDQRVTDHRIGVTLHQLDAILGGELQPLLDALRSHEEDEGRSP